MSMWLFSSMYVGFVFYPSVTIGGSTVCFLFVYAGVIHKLLGIPFYRYTAWFAAAPIRRLISQWVMSR